MSKLTSKSLWIYHFAAASCNNCDIEIHASLTVKFDAERYGIKLVESIRHADCMVITGVVNSKNLSRLKAIYNESPKPIYIIAVGTCALDIGIFRDAYNVAGPVDKHINVDVYVPGCPPKPEAFLSGVLKLIEKIAGEQKKKRRRLKGKKYNEFH